MAKNKPDVCPVEHAGSLDNRFRRLFQSPKKILKPYINPGMTVMDMGCGPGYFTLDMAQLAGPEGLVIAADLQQGMLDKVKAKIAGTDLEQRIELKLCAQDSLAQPDSVDFVLAFYMVHEVPEVLPFFKEIAETLKPGGKLLIVEPPFHVSKKKYRENLNAARNAGLVLLKEPRCWPDKAALFQKA